MNYYAYFIMRHGKKLVGGALHADSMEDAGRRILVQNDVTAVANDNFSPPMHDFFRNGERVSVAIWLPAELFAKAKGNK